MKEAVTGGKELSIEERNLLSVAYKNVVGSKRSAWRVIYAIRDKNMEDDGHPVHEYLKTITREVIYICDEVLVCV